MATPSLIQQGVLVADKQYYHPGSHINSTNLFNVGTSDMQNIGLIETWTQMFRNVQPLYNFDQIAKKVRTVESEKGFTWSTKIALENTKVVEDLSDTDKPGIDGQEFRVAFDKPFSVTQAITYDHLNASFSLLVTQEPYQDGDRFIHVLKIHGGSSNKSYLPKEFLTPGTEYYKAGSYRGDEYDTVAKSYSAEAGERTWHYYLGNSEAAAEFEISKKAVIMLKAGKATDPAYRVWEIGKFKPGTDGYKFMIGEPSVHLSKVLKDAYKGDAKAMKGDISGKNWFFELEKQCMDELMTDYIMNLMWGTGGRTQIQYDTISVTPGLYWQYKKYGNVKYFNLAQFSLDYLRSELENHFRHRIDFGSDTTLLLKCGSGIYNIAKQEIKKEFNSVGLVVDDTQRFLEGTRFELNFAMEFNAFYLRQFPKVKVVLVHEPALDPVHGNELSNPIIDRHHRLSSYSIMVYNLNDLEADNIQLVKWAYDDKMRYQKLIGNVDWNDQNAVFVSSGNFSGIKGTMSKRHDGIWLVDASKSLMFEMINPKAPTSSIFSLAR